MGVIVIDLVNGEETENTWKKQNKDKPAEKDRLPFPDGYVEPGLQEIVPEKTPERNKRLPFVDIEKIEKIPPVKKQPIFH
jgi:hypothetical protein